MNEMVSIIIPTYNRENEIGRAIQSILKQTYRQYEIIIVDDGSTDNTKSAVLKIGDNRIRYIQLERNQGVGHARNVGIKEARYDYIAFLDSDDEWLPDKLELQMNKMLVSSKKLGLIYCRMGGYQRNSRERYVCPSLKLSKEVLEKNMFEKLLVGNVIGTPTMLVRKECLDEAGGFKESLMCLEDWEMILRIVQKWEIGFVDKVLVEVHKLDGSVSTNVGGYLVTRCYMVSLYRKEMERIGILENVKTEILGHAKNVGLYEEIDELLKRDFCL